MSFQKVGPYRLTRADLVVASVVISFIIGSKKTRIWSVLYLLLGIMLLGVGLVIGAFIASALGLFLIIYMFVAIPALRYKKNNKNIYLSYSEQGLVADTGDMATTYRWITIGKLKRVGSRLFIMINNGCALVLSERMTSSENIEKIILTITQELRKSLTK